MESAPLTTDFALRLRAMAEVIVRVGLNLQPRQPLLVGDPYDLQGVHPEAMPLVAAVRAMTSGEVTVIEGDPARLRRLVETDDLAGFEALVATNTRRLRDHLARGGAFLFLPGTEPRLLAGVPDERLSRFDGIKWRHLGPVVQRLVRGASQWTLAPAPTAAWAALAYAELPVARQLPALWDTVFLALRVATAGTNSPAADPVATWQAHLEDLTRRRDELNVARYRRIRYVGAGTELTLDLPRSHAWCTARLETKAGLPFVVNLPTEEIFTAPQKCSATGRVRIARPVTHGGALIDGIEMQFRRGRVTTATAAANGGLLQRLLATDDGADRVGEVAIVPGRSGLPWGDRCLHHILLDENAAPHIALGDAYRFCSKAFFPLAINCSQVHLDLPLDAKVELL